MKSTGRRWTAVKWALFVGLTAVIGYVLSPGMPTQDVPFVVVLVCIAVAELIFLAYRNQGVIY